MSEKIKIFIADDNAEFVSTLVTYLDSQEDLEVVATARDGVEAVDKLTEIETDIAILDVIMPQLDGLGVLEAINERLEALPICIMLSAVGQDKVTAKAMCLGAQYYVVKPFEMEVLVKRIRELVKNQPMEKLSPALKEVKTTYIEVEKNLGEIAAKPEKTESEESDLDEEKYGQVVPEIGKPEETDSEKSESEEPEPEESESEEPESKETESEEPEFKEPESKETKPEESESKESESKELEPKEPERKESPKQDGQEKVRNSDDH